MKTIDDGYVSFGHVARSRLREQCQYARHWLKEPDLTEGVRWRGNIEMYHGLEIHADDVETFVARVAKKHRIEPQKA